MNGLKNKRIDEVATWKNVDHFFNSEFQKIIVLAKSPSAQGCKLAIEKLRCINSILNRIPKDERNAVYCTYFKNMSAKDSSIMLEISEPTLLKRKYRGSVQFAELYPYEDLAAYKEKEPEK